MISEVCISPINYKVQGRTTGISAATGAANISVKEFICKSGQNTSINSYERRLKDIEKHLKNCKRENYETIEEFQKDYDYWTKKYEQIQAQMMEADNGYTAANTDAKTKKLGAVGKFIKDCCDGVKALGMDIINGVVGIFKPKTI